MTTFKKIDLFGGAISAELPTNFGDVSNIRQVPDNQEVYLAKDGLTSIIFEITERIETPDYPCKNDQEALQYHYEDMLASGYRTDKPESEIKEETRTWSTANAFISSLGHSTPAYTLLGTQRSETNAGSDSIATTGGSKPVDFVAILFTLIRLKEKETDILIYVNVPHERGEYNPVEVDLAKAKYGPTLKKAVEMRDKIFQSFSVQDWALFG